MLVDKLSELMSDLLFTVHQHGADDVTWKPPILHQSLAQNLSDVWRFTFEIRAAQLRSVAEIAPQPFLCVSRGPIRMIFALAQYASGIVWTWPEFFTPPFLPKQQLCTFFCTFLYHHCTIPTWISRFLEDVNKDNDFLFVLVNSDTFL